MCVMSIILFILGFIELGVVAYHLVKYWNTNDNEIAAAVGAIVCTNLACALIYFFLGMYLNGWL